MSESWRVFPHLPIEELSSNLWHVEGAMPDMPIRRVMNVFRRSDGDLVVHNAIALDEPSMQRLDAWGSVAHILVPNGFHRMDAPLFAQRYPKAKFYAPTRSLEKVRQKVPSALDLSELPSDPNFEVRSLAGTDHREACFIVRHDGKHSAIVTDVIFNAPHTGGFKGFMLKNVLRSTGGPRVSFVARMVMVKDKAVFAEELRSLATLENLTNVIVSHHEIIRDNPAEVLRTLADTLA
jgi:hypothetical protein